MTPTPTPPTPTPTCCICSRPAEYLDTEYDEAYCQTHADSYDIWSGPWRQLDEGPGPELPRRRRRALPG